MNLPFLVDDDDAELLVFHPANSLIIRASDKGMIDADITNYRYWLSDGEGGGGRWELTDDRCVKIQEIVGKEK